MSTERRLAVDSIRNSIDSTKSMLPAPGDVGDTDYLINSLRKLKIRLEGIQGTVGDFQKELERTNPQ